jgi:hypothetical protein
MVDMMARFFEMVGTVAAVIAVLSGVVWALRRDR